MPVKINYNICDNAAECSGIAACPTGALFWDHTKQSLLGEKGMLCADNSKCISCGRCVSDEGCPIGAIFYAKTDKELDEMTAGYETNMSQVERLFVERYGAAPIDESLCVGDNELQEIISGNEGILLLEEYADSSIQCLLSSIPIETIIHEVHAVTGMLDVRFYRVDVSEDVMENVALPILKIYKKSDLIGQIEGYYSNEQLDEFKSLLQVTLS